MILLYSGICFSFDLIPERRKDQNPTQPAHLIVPLPYSKPGVGEGVALLGTITNVAETTADLSAVMVTGDAAGFILNGTEIPLYSDSLFLNFSFLDINRAAVNNYSIRGINNTDKNDFTILDLSVVKSNNIGLNFTFYDRRLNFNYSYRQFENKIDAIRDNDGGLITQYSKPFFTSGDSEKFSALFDFTDDYLDARKGVRLEMSYQEHKANTVKEPDYYTIDLNLLGYIPVNDTDTLVLNHYQSSAHVRRKGDINPTNIRAELNSNCAPADTVCLTTENELVNNLISQRTYGTSTSLGGDLRLRSFPQGRYQGAHTAFIGAEYRWNILQEATPFDYYIWKDVRTGIQVAFFAELGTVSETPSQLWKESRYSVGTGLRLVAASGAVYRADIATGKEGAEFVVIFYYPWE